MVLSFWIGLSHVLGSNARLQTVSKLALEELASAGMFDANVG